MRGRPEADCPQRHTPAECPYRVVFHAGAFIADCPTPRAAAICAEGEVLMSKRRVNVYPRNADGTLGPRIAAYLPDGPGRVRVVQGEACRKRIEERTA